MVLPIVQYGHPVLRQKGRRVEQIDDRLRQLVADMLETMHDAHGIGLAAQQIGQAIQLAVVDVLSLAKERPSALLVRGEEQDLAQWMPLVLINPELTLEGDRDVISEGCLSFPDINGAVSRPKRALVKTQLLDGRQVEFEAVGMLARCIQHEVDHLNGVLFIDRMNSATRASINGRLKRLQRGD
ncbi:MAG: peptide deformylase [Verrucomicrobia bacterium]|nr:peptide deformylase [Verrucomicrobiota bacterium]